MNIIVTIAAIFISIGISSFFSSAKAKIISLGIGATIIFWVWLVSYINHLPHKKDIVPPENTKSATLSKNSNELKFPDHKFIELPEKITITFANNSVSYNVDILKDKKVTPFNIADVKIFAFIENNILYADVEIFGGKNQQPINIKKNTISLLPSGWDFNATNKALEIINEKQIPMYQLIYRSPNHIELKGIFVTKVGLVVANEDGIQMNPKLPIAHKMKRIFKYPSWKYPGEYEN